ncbi:MAG: lysophospholipid acyltransferase family protein [Longimicrobiales bacterium]
MRAKARYRLAGWLGQHMLDALLATARFEVSGADAYRRYWTRGSPVIFVLWHGRLLPLTYLHRHQGIGTLISRSEDGEYIARIVERWGYTTARGSSTRGGAAALRELVRCARAGRSLAFTPDGPRGPRERVKPGVLTAAQLAGIPLVPIAGGTDRAWWFEGWDRFLVPKPFARIRVAYGEPLEVPRAADAPQLTALATELERRLQELMQQVDTPAARGSITASHSAVRQ